MISLEYAFCLGSSDQTYFFFKKAAGPFSPGLCKLSAMSPDPEIIR
jgi:hypothetical protein